MQPIELAAIEAALERLAPTDRALIDAIALRS